MEIAELAMYVELLLVAGLYASYDLCVDAEALADLDDVLCLVGGEVYLHAVTHVEHLVHLCPVRVALLVDGLEERRHGEHVVLDDVQFVDEVQDLCLCATRAVHHAVYVVAHLVEDLLDDGSVGAGGGEHQFARIDGTSLDGVGQVLGARVYQFTGYRLVVALRVLLCEVLGEHVVA